MDTTTLLSALFDGDATMTNGRAFENNTHCRDSEDISFAAISAFLNEYSPVETLTRLEDNHDLLEVNDKGYTISPSSAHRQLEDIDNSDSDRALLQLGRSRKRAKAHHYSHKDQVARLEAEAVDLQAKLLSLQYKSARADSDKAATAEPIPSHLQQIWRRMALSQLDRRQEAEAENLSLRKMVAIQVCEAKNLRRLLKRRTRIEMMDDMLGAKAMLKLKQTAHNDADMFQKLSQDADARYCTIDHLFQAKDMDTLPFTGHSRQVNLENTKGVFYEVCQKRLFPFNLRETGDAVWQRLRTWGTTNMRSIGGPTMWLNSHDNGAKVEEDTLKYSYSVVVSGVEDFIGTYNWKVVRRFKESKRIVFIRRIVGEASFQSGHSGVIATTTTFVVLEEDGSDSTEMKVYFTAERGILPDTENATARMGIAVFGELVPRFSGDVEATLMERQQL